jgi:hypothetical protein
MIWKSLLATLSLLASCNAGACGCSSPSSLSDTKDWSYAFVGEVIAVQRTQRNGIIEELVTFQVTQNITDVKGGSVKVLFRKGLTSCDLIEPNFRKGESYTITTRSGFENGALYSNFCDLRKKH